MRDKRNLGIAFISRRPESAARVIVSKDPADAAVFLGEIPGRIAVRAIAWMMPRQAAAIFAEMDTATGAACMREMRSHQACAVLRVLHADQRRRLLEQLPRRLRRDFERSLAFAPDTVGAHMTTVTATCFETDRPADALATVRDHPEDKTDVVFVLDGQHRCAGAVALADLLRASAAARMDELLDSDCPALAANARIDTVAALDAWHIYNRLPVTNRRGELIGVLTRQMLRLDAGRDAAAADRPTASLGEAMAGALAACASGLADLLLPQPNNDK